MSGAPPMGGQEKLPGQTAGTSDAVLAAAVRVQRRRHRWALAAFWSILGLGGCYVVNSDASSNGTPSPSWFIDLTIAFGAVAGAALLVVIGYSVAMRRMPAQAREQAVLLERQRLRRQRWPNVVFALVFWPALWLGMALLSFCAVLFTIALANGLAYVAGDGQVVRWAAIPIKSDGDAAVAIIVGLLLIFSEVLLVYWVCRRAKRVWWPRYVQHRARASRY